MQRRSQAKLFVFYVGLYEDKKRGMVETYQTGDYTMKDITAQFEVHYSTVSRADIICRTVGCMIARLDPFLLQ